MQKKYTTKINGKICYLKLQINRHMVFKVQQLVSSYKPLTAR